MTIRPVDFNGMLQRTDDIGMLKKHEDAKPIYDQQNIQTQINHREDELAHRVLNSSETEHANNDSDAKNQGKGTYYASDRKKKKKQQETQIIKKNAGGSFDIKI